MVTEEEKLIKLNLGGLGNREKLVLQQVFSEDQSAAQAARIRLQMACITNQKRVVEKLASSLTPKEIEELTAKAKANLHHLATANQLLVVQAHRREEPLQLSEAGRPIFVQAVTLDLDRGLVHVNPRNPNFEAAKYGQIAKVLQALGLAPYQQAQVNDLTSV
ncbi:hypothetical protein HY387_01015 [Candidatus Daviesbacteria bacterium]|nr:hypothetical protein [Candidatus Daviesbacteria bacterium]